MKHAKFDHLYVKVPPGTSPPITCEPCGKHIAAGDKMMEVPSESSDYEIESMYCEGCVVDAVKERRPSIARETKRIRANYLQRAEDIREWIEHVLILEWEHNGQSPGAHLHEFLYGRGGHAPLSCSGRGFFV